MGLGKPLAGGVWALHLKALGASEPCAPANPLLLGALSVAALGNLVFLLCGLCSHLCMILCRNPSSDLYEEILALRASSFLEIENN